jgi:uncharacterized membrane protein YhfC
MLLSPLLIPLLQTGPVSSTLTQTATASGTVTPTITVSPAVIQAVQSTPIPPLYNIGSVITIILILLFVVGVPFILIRRFGVSLRYMLWGALAGFSSQMIVVPLVQQGIGSVLTIPTNPDDTTLLGLALIGSLVAGAVGALGFFLVCQLVLKFDDERTWVGAVMTGTGAAAVLLVINFALSSVTGLISSLQWPPSPSAINQLPDDVKVQLPDTVNAIKQLSGYEWIPALWFALTLGIVTIAAAVLVFAYFRRRDWTWLAAAVGLLLLVTASGNAYGGGNIVGYVLSGPLGVLNASIVLMLVDALLAYASIYFIRRLYEPPEVKAAAPAPATVVDAEPIMPDHSELETPSAPRRKRRR